MRLPSEAAMRSMRPLLLALALGVLSVAETPAGASELEQSQGMVDSGLMITQTLAGWQTFTPGIGGKLDAVELVLQKSPCFFPPCGAGSPLIVDVVATSGGVPTDTVLGTASVPLASVLGSQTWVLADFSASDVHLDAGTLYALHLTSASPGGPAVDTIMARFQTGLDPYAEGQLFDDLNSADGLDDPVTTDFPGSDFAFRTYMTGELCGDGQENGAETCDDGNTVGGDGCSATCQDEACGNGVVDVGESCDDGNTVSGDGCDASCALEPDALACQTAIAKAGAKLAVARFLALQKCRNLLASGKSLSVADPADCASETSAARAIAKARATARKTIAEGKPARCSDALVAALATCADTIDGLVSADGTAGCLVSQHDGNVGDLLFTEYGY